MLAGSLGRADRVSVILERVAGQGSVGIEAIRRAGTEVVVAHR